MDATLAFLGPPVVCPGLHDALDHIYSTRVFHLSKLNIAT